MLAVRHAPPLVVDPEAPPSRRHGARCRTVRELALRDEQVVGAGERVTCPDCLALALVAAGHAREAGAAR